MTSTPSSATVSVTGCPVCHQLVPQGHQAKTANSVPFLVFPRCGLWASPSHRTKMQNPSFVRAVGRLSEIKRGFPPPAMECRCKSPRTLERGSWLGSHLSPLMGLQFPCPKPSSSVKWGGPCSLSGFAEAQTGPSTMISDSFQTLRSPRAPRGPDLLCF